MSTYRLFFNTGASCIAEVEADDLDAALDLAYDELPSGVCAMCAGYGGGVGIELGGDWQFDESGHDVDGEWIEAGK